MKGGSLEAVNGFFVLSFYLPSFMFILKSGSSRAPLRAAGNLVGVGNEILLLLQERAEER
jgi:hypothetical protein